MTDEDFSFAKQKEYMDKLILEMIQGGKDVNDILDMPFNFVVDLLNERNKPKKTDSLISAFGG